MEFDVDHLLRRPFVEQRFACGHRPLVVHSEVGGQQVVNGERGHGELDRTQLCEVVPGSHRFVVFSAMSSWRSAPRCRRTWGGIQYEFGPVGMAGSGPNQHLKMPTRRVANPSTV